MLEWKITKYELVKCSVSEWEMFRTEGYTNGQTFRRRHEPRGMGRFSNSEVAAIERLCQVYDIEHPRIDRAEKARIEKENKIRRTGEGL